MVRSAKARPGATFGENLVAWRLWASSFVGLAGDRVVAASLSAFASVAVGEKPGAALASVVGIPGVVAASPSVVGNLGMSSVVWAASVLREAAGKATGVVEKAIGAVEKVTEVVGMSYEAAGIAGAVGKAIGAAAAYPGACGAA